MKPRYLSAACFLRPNSGPAVLDKYGKPRLGLRDPSPLQIRLRCWAVQDCWSERERQFRKVPHLDGVAKEEVPPEHWSPPTTHVSAEDMAAITAVA